MQAAIIYTGMLGVTFNFTVGCIDGYSNEEKEDFANKAFQALNCGAEDEFDVRNMAVGDMLLFNDRTYLVCLPHGWASISREQAVTFQKVCFSSSHIKRLDMLKEFEKRYQMA